jgi:hypothetical protein
MLSWLRPFIREPQWFLFESREPAPMSFTATILEVAREEIGQGETVRNNVGPRLDDYRGFRGGDGAWCASFASWVFIEAARRLGATFPPAEDKNWSRYRHVAKRLHQLVARYGEAVTTPQPGDLMTLDRGKVGSWQGHSIIVEEVRDGVVHTIEGNVGTFPAKVRRFRHDITHERLEGFARPKLEV